MAEKFQSKNSLPKNASSSAVKLETWPTIIDDLEKFYSDEFFTDVSLKTKTNSFPAHKFMLCARSPVFKAMMSNNMKEKNSGTIKMDDLDDDTLRRLLLFIYTDSIEDLKWEDAMKLYFAADKYEIIKLRLMCCSFLIENLTVSTAVEVLLLADTHSDTDLREDVEEFILEHDEEVFASNEFKMLMTDDPQLALKTIHLKYKKKKSKDAIREALHQNHGVPEYFGTGYQRLPEFRFR